MIVLDSSAVIAFLFDEPGTEVVRGILDEACMSTVALAECLGRLARSGTMTPAAMEQFRGTGLEIVPFDEAQAEIAGSLIMPARPLNIGLGDCCTIALAIMRKCPLVTGDREWRRLNLPVDVRLIR